MASPLFTIGHSVRPLGVFVDLLKAAEVRLVVDVRAIPRSRTNPQYNGDTLPSSLSGFRIGYEHVAELGGRRGRQPRVPSPRMRSGRTKVFTITPTTRWARTFTPRWRNCVNSVIPSGAPSCAQRRYGGGVTGGSFQIIGSPPARLSFTFSGQITSREPS
jgi:Protein of unknown function, DUF488